MPSWRKSLRLEVSCAAGVRVCDLVRGNERRGVHHRGEEVGRQLGLSGLAGWGAGRSRTLRSDIELAGTMHNGFLHKKQSGETLEDPLKTPKECFEPRGNERFLAIVVPTLMATHSCKRSDFPDSPWAYCACTQPHALSECLAAV